MFEKGIVDAAKVTRSALQNAASIAAMVLTTETADHRPARAEAGRARRRRRLWRRGHGLLAQGPRTATSSRTVLALIRARAVLGVGATNFEQFQSERLDPGQDAMERPERPRHAASSPLLAASRACNHRAMGGPGEIDETPTLVIPIVPDRSPAQTTPSRSAIIKRALVVLAVVVVVFGIVLPRLIDFGAVRDALAALTAGQLALLAAASAVAYVVNAGPYRVLVHGLTWPRAVGSDMAARAVVSTVPGPTDVATRFVLYRQWEIPTDVATAGIVFAALFETFSILALPPIATVGVLLSGGPTSERALPFALLSLLVLIAGALLLLTIVRSYRLARTIGEWLDRVARRLWTLFRRTPPEQIVERVLDLRVRAKAMLSRHGLLGFAAAVGAKLAWFLVLEVALWCVGIGPDVLPPSAVLASMAVVGIVALIPITPGAVGITEVAYIGVLSSVAPGLTEELTAAILLYRIAQWLVPIPIGWVLLIVMRRGHWGEVFEAPDVAPGATALVEP